MGLGMGLGVERERALISSRWEKGQEGEVRVGMDRQGG